MLLKVVLMLIIARMLVRNALVGKRLCTERRVFFLVEFVHPGFSIFRIRVARRQMGDHVAVWLNVGGCVINVSVALAEQA